MPPKSPNSSTKTHTTPDTCVRKSPRLSSTPSPIAHSDAKNRKSKSEDLALSLYVIHDEDNELFVPLKIYNPSLSGDKFRPRSPGSAGNEVTRLRMQNVDSIGAISAPDEQKCLRKSPRFTKIESRSVGPTASKQIVDLIDLKTPLTAVRRLPRLSLPSTVSQSGGRDVNGVKSESDKRRSSEKKSPSSVVVGAKRLRSRMIPGSVVEVALPDTEECGLIEWSDKRQSSEKKSPSSVVVGEKRLRSRMIRGDLVEVALFDSEEERPSKKAKMTLGVSGEGKMLEKGSRKSRRHASSSNGDKNENVKLELLALPAPSPEKCSSKEKKGRSEVSSLGERSLRSRKVAFNLVGAKYEEDVSVINKEPGIIIRGKQERCDFEELGEKCSKSRTSPSRSVKAKNGEVKSPLIESPAVSSEKCLRSRKIPFCVAGSENVERKLELTEVDSEGSEKKQRKQKIRAFFIGDQVPEEEARERWRWRYELKGLQSQRSKAQTWKLNADEEDEIILNVECHYTQAKVNGCIYDLGECAYIKGDGRQKHVGRIIEFFKTVEGEDYFRVQWFYRAQDTVMKEAAAFHDRRRLFYSTVMNDNLLDCIISKVGVKQVKPTLGLNLNSVPPSEFYYDMEYCVEYSTFRTLLNDNTVESHDSSSPNFVETPSTMINMTSLEDTSGSKEELGLLDLYSGCGGMSTGLCLGTRLSGVTLVTRWAVDYDSYACDSLKLNHPETHVRNESAEDFLELLKEWEKLCNQYVFNDVESTLQSGATEARGDINSSSALTTPAGEYEVLCLVDICYGDPSNSGKRGVNFKVRWKGYSSSEDTWEPIQSLSNCKERVRDFVRSGFQSKLLPLPGRVDVVCGGPPCQGISGYNRYRNFDSPLDDERNRQLIVFMDIVKFLKPKYVLMENVSDILRFDKASLGRYALSRLVHMRYQARLGMIAAGCYGIPQFRLRVFLWGALPNEKLPQFPLPTHDVVVRYWPPPEFEQNTVAYDEDQPRQLEEAVILRDAISDLPAVTSHEIREEMTYQMPPETEFQKYIRLTKYATFPKVDKDIATRMRSVTPSVGYIMEIRDWPAFTFIDYHSSVTSNCWFYMMGLAPSGVTQMKIPTLYDHRPYQLSEDDYLRVCQIPHKKGANFRDLPGVVVRADNTVGRDPTKEPMKLPSGKPMVPDYAFTFEQGKSKKPFARLWWDETVATVVTFPNLHSQVAIHPEQDRVLTLREYARLQGFPDFYRFCGTVKKRYCQVGNAVAVPVARALGYTLGMAAQKLGGDEPLMTLPPKFSVQRPSVD